jgi:hypothetical protein
VKKVNVEVGEGESRVDGYIVANCHGVQLRASQWLGSMSWDFQMLEFAFFAFVLYPDWLA